MDNAAHLVAVRFVVRKPQIHHPRLAITTHYKWLQLLLALLRLTHLLLTLRNGVYVQARTANLSQVEIPLKCYPKR